MKSITPQNFMYTTKNDQVRSTYPCQQDQTMTVRFFYAIIFHVLVPSFNFFRKYEACLIIFHHHFFNKHVSYYYYIISLLSYYYHIIFLFSSSRRGCLQPVQNHSSRKRCCRLHAGYKAAPARLRLIHKKGPMQLLLVDFLYDHNRSQWFR